MKFDELFHASEDSLDRCTRDLTAAARAGQLDPVRCREDEIARVIDILLRHGKNNPALVGVAGVGKTAIAEGLAQRIAEGRVPLALRQAKLLALDHVSLVAGTMFRGQYEERLKAVVSAASEDPNIILFVDELHNLIGQGTAMGVAMDAANMLKPALVRGEFRVIGATTQDEYDRWIRGDPALERRFQTVNVRELTPEQTLDVLRARRERLEVHHNVAIAEDALIASVELTDRYVTNRARPDKAIDALDEACAHAQAVATYSEELEAMILKRRELRQLAEQAKAFAPEPNADAAPQRRASELENDALERFAREGLAALERFGAEMEAVFTGQRAPVSSRSPASPPSPPPVDRPLDPQRESLDARAKLARLDTELNRKLIDEGFVVRGVDVARVVALTTGQTVTWSA